MTAPQVVVITGAGAGVGRPAAEVERDLGPIDVWINNAMTTVFAFLDD